MVSSRARTDRGGRAGGAVSPPLLAWAARLFPSQGIPLRTISWMVWSRRAGRGGGGDLPEPTVSRSGVNFAHMQRGRHSP